ncbi:hypothetical protein BS78_03G052700 [Paspalum vaginatum]|nr:hypothetical protein BS78_03G052700 [Paspalum vaginatum]
MLQWTGGSRRKVYASRKSTQSRQRQYFEQKRRQQQGPELHNQNDVAGSQASNDQEPRSLDVLNINNLATPKNHHGESTNVDIATPQVDRTLSDTSPIVALKKITSLRDSNMKEAGSQPRLSPPFGHQDVAAAVRSHEEPLGCRVSPSINYSTRKQNQNLELQSEISLIDLVSYEGPKNKSTAQPAREAHVSFSVKGLGHIKMETPPHSPMPIKRVLPLPPKAMRFTHKAKRSIPFDVTKALDSMNSINILKDRRPLAKMDSILDESGYEMRKPFDCYFTDSFENHSANLCLEDEDIFSELQAKKDCQSKHSISDGSLADENSDRLWRIDKFDLEDHFPSPRGEYFDTSNCGFKDNYSPERRNPTRCSTRFENIDLGHIKMETPPHSPRPIKRVLPLPPKAMRFTPKAKRSIPFDVTKALDSMNSINTLKERRPPAKMDSILDESGYGRRKPFDCYFTDSFENHNANLCLEDVDIFSEPQAEKDWQSKHSRADGNLADDNSDRLWRIDKFDSVDHFPTRKGEHSDTSDYGFVDNYSPERRNPTRCSTRFEDTGIISPHDLFSDHSLMDGDEGTEFFEWERRPPSTKMPNLNSTSGPSVRSFDKVDDSEKMKSPMSEESCSSAVGQSCTLDVCVMWGLKYECRRGGKEQSKLVSDAALGQS